MVDKWDRKHKKKAKKSHAAPAKEVADVVDKKVNRTDTNKCSLISKAEVGGVAVWWLCNRKGQFPAREFFDATAECRGALAAIIRSLVATGLPSRIPERGHRLGGDFSELWVLKPGDYRFVGFFDERNFVVCVGAPKRTNAKQETDYHEALRYMVEYYKKPNEEKK